MMANVAAIRPPVGVYQALLSPVLAVLAVATMLELLLLRTFTRSAIHIPDVEALQAPYFVLADLGRFAYFTAVASLLCAMFLAVAVNLRRPDARAWAAAFGAGLFVVAAALARLEAVPGLFSTALTGAAVVVGGAAAAAGSVRLAAFVVPVVAAFTLGVVYALDQAAGTGGLSWLHGTREVPILGAALLAPLAFNVRLAGRNLVVAIAVAVTVFAVFAANPSTSRILLLWNAGLPGVLPGAAYAVAAGLAAATLASLVHGSRWIPAIALLLVVASGAGVENTYQSGLLVCALLLLALPDTTAPDASDVVQPQERLHLAEDAAG